MSQPELSEDRPFVFSNQRAQPATNTLASEKGEVRLEPRLMTLLCLFASHPGHVWSREELLARLWPDTHVAEDALTRAVSDLRKALGDDPRRPTFIATIPKRGYRFLPTVQFETRPVPPHLEVATAMPSAHKKDEPDPASAPIERAPVTAPPAIPWQPVIAVLLGAVALVFLINGVLRRGPEPPPNLTVAALPEQEIVLTNYPGLERQPALSPDGSRIAFVKEHNGFRRLFLTDSHGGAERLLCDADGDHANPTWFADGTRLAFSRRIEDRTELVVCSAMGGQVTPLYRGGAVDGIAVGHNHRFIYFAEQHDHTAHFQLQRLDRENGAVIPLAETDRPHHSDIQPRLAPDGSRLAFVRVSEAGAHYLMQIDLANGVTRPLTEPDMRTKGFAWVDDQHLVIAKHQQGTYYLWLLALQDGSETWLPTRGERSITPSFSPAAGTLVYEKVTYNKSIYVVDTEQPGSDHRPLVASNYYDCEPFFSPDQTRLLFTSSRSGTLELWCTDASGQNPRQLTKRDSPFLTRPRWAKSGPEAAVSALKAGTMHIYIVNAETGTVRDSGATGMLCDWSHDNTGLYMARTENGQSQLFHFDLESGRETLVQGNDAFIGRESPDGRRLFFSYRRRTGLWSRPLHQPDAKPELVIPDLAVNQHLNWDLSQQHLFFAAELDGRTHAFRADFNGENRRDLGALPRLAAPSLSVSRDGKKLLYGRVLHYEIDLILTRKPFIDKGSNH